MTNPIAAAAARDTCHSLPRRTPRRRKVGISRIGEVVLMSDPSAEERVVRAFLRARDCRDYASAVALIAKDCVWHSPINGPVQGRGRVREMLESAEEDTAWFSSQLYGFEHRSGRVLARVRNQAERDGKSLDSTQLLAFVVTRDKISEIRIFVDDPEAVKDFWAG